MFVTPEQALFVEAPEPLLVVTGVAEAAELPELAVTDGRAARCDGWRLLPRMTMCVVDGPGDAGSAGQQSGPLSLQGRLAGSGRTW